MFISRPINEAINKNLEYSKLLLKENLNIFQKNLFIFYVTLKYS